MSGGRLRPARLRPGLLACASLICAAALVATPAGAAIVTVGPVLGSATVEGHAGCEAPSGCLVAQKTPSFTAPVTGKIVGWRVKGATGTFSLQVLSGNTGGASFRPRRGGRRQNLLPRRNPDRGG